MNVIFLDIDGVVKPARCYWRKRVTMEDLNFDPLGIDAVNRLAHRCDAGVVFNTTWNRTLDTMDKTYEFARNIGLTCPVYGRTKYPFGGVQRLEAIEDWLNITEKKIDKWIALDDCPIDHPNAILIDGEMGITVNDYRKASEILGNPDRFICLI